MKLQMDFEFELLSVPNFIILKAEATLRQHGFQEARKISIGELSDKQLRRIAKLWTQKLLDRANEIRRNPQNIGPVNL